MYYEFIDLKDAPLSVRELVENIHMVINQVNRVAEGIIDGRECKEIVNTFINAEKILASAMTMESEDKDALLLFQMAVYRWCTIHIPFILEKITDESKKLEDETMESEGSIGSSLFTWLSYTTRCGPYSSDLAKLDSADMEERQVLAMKKVLSLLRQERLSVENFRKWEEEFWEKGADIFQFWNNSTDIFQSRPPASIYRVRQVLRKLNTVEKNSDRDGYDTMTVREVMDLAFQDKGTIEKVEELQQYYKPLKTKAKKLNIMLKNDGMKDELEKIRDMTNIVDRGIQGELTAADIMELEENIQLWHGGLQSLMNFFN